MFQITDDGLFEFVLPNDDSRYFGGNGSEYWLNKLLLEWLRQNIGVDHTGSNLTEFTSGWAIEHISTTGISMTYLYFALARDAVLFKMSWCDAFGRHGRRIGNHILV